MEEKADNVDFSVLGTRKIRTMQDLEKALMYDRIPAGMKLTDEEGDEMMAEWLESLDKGNATITSPIR